MAETMYNLLKECYESTGIAKIDLRDKDTIAIKLNKKYLRNKNKDKVFSNIENLCSIFQDYSKKMYLDTYERQHHIYSPEKLLSGKNISEIIDEEYKHQDPNYRVIVFDTIPKSVITLEDYRYIKVRLPENKEKYSELDDIIIHTKGYVKKSDGKLDYNNKKSLNLNQTKKYLAFIIGIMNTFMYEKYNPKPMCESKEKDTE